MEPRFKVMQAKQGMKTIAQRMAEAQGEGGVEADGGGSSKSGSGTLEAR